MTQVRRRRRRKNQTSQQLIALLAVLVVILVAVVIIAVQTHDGGADTPSGNDEQTLQNSASTGDTTQPDTSAGTEESTPPTQEPTDATNPSETDLPDYGEYIDVGTGYIAEIITYTAETFNGKTTDDYSSPTRNYLPEGTVDYASPNEVSNSSASYMLLRCGRRVYVTKSNLPSTKRLPVVECYEGTLPDHNEIGFVSMEQEEHFTILTLDVLWKAPFYFNFSELNYIDPSIRDYRVTEFTAEYVDITFCYATQFEGYVQIDENNPLFSHATVTQGEKDCTLRLYLKKPGGFYGYDTYYNENDQLCFKFLNPVSAKESSNSYGADLTGIRIMLDVGHGGVDGGSVTDGVKESDLNLKLAKVLKKELESMGATVILNRSDNSRLTVDERISALKEAWPDLCIAIHQNAYPQDSSYGGFQLCYSNPFSHDLAQLMYEYTMDTGIYRDGFKSWHYYFVARQTNCPVILTENGYMTNPTDLANMQSDSVLQKKAQAIAQAVADYYLNIG